MEINNPRSERQESSLIKSYAKILNLKNSLKKIKKQNFRNDYYSLCKLPLEVWCWTMSPVEMYKNYTFQFFVKFFSIFFLNFLKYSKNFLKTF